MPNPKIQSQSYGIEGVIPVAEMDFVPFQGGMDIVHEKYQLKLASYSKVQNMRPMRPGLMKRKGQTPIHTTPDGSNKAVNLFMFSKGTRSELHTYAQLSDGDVQEAANNPPAVTSGAFGTNVYTSPSPSTMLPGSFSVLDDKLYYADGTGAPQVYSGFLTPVASFVVYKGTAAIPVMPKSGSDYSLRVMDDEVSTVAILDSLGTLAAYHAVFIRTSTPANALTFTLASGKENTSAAVAQLHYWNGAWSAVASQVDGTIASAGITLGQPGSMSFTMPTDHIPSHMFDASGYWYRLSLASGALDSEVEITKVTYESNWQPIQNTWDGIPTSAIEAYLYIAATTSYEFYSGTSITLDAMLAADKIYFNSFDPIDGFYVNVGAIPNLLATTVTVKYHNGVDFVTVSGLSDATAIGAISLAQSGWVSFTRPTDQQPGMFQSSYYYSSWYEISFSSALTPEMVISIETKPVHDLLDFGKCLALCAWKRRMVYSFDKVPGYIAVSAAGMPSTLNGDDYAILDIGDGRSNKAVCFKRFYTELLVWQEEKGKDGGCLTIIEGYSPTTFGKRIVSTIHGTFSAKSAVVVEDVPSSGKLTVASGQLVSTETKIAAAFFLSRDGVFMTDGKGIEMVSAEIQDYFDPKDPKCIRRGYEKEHWIDYDSIYRVLRVGLVTGPTATVPNVFLIYDVKTSAWSCDDLAQGLSCHTEMEAASGQFPIVQIGGGAIDGTIYQLNNSLTDNGTTITAFVTMEFDGGGHDLHLNEIVLRASGACTLETYADDVLDATINIT